MSGLGIGHGAGRGLGGGQRAGVGFRGPGTAREIAPRRIVVVIGIREPAAIMRVVVALAMCAIDTWIPPDEHNQVLAAIDALMDDDD
jgi:hypothetical protein